MHGSLKTKFQAYVGLPINADIGQGPDYKIKDSLGKTLRKQAMNCGYSEIQFEYPDKTYPADRKTKRVRVIIGGEQGNYTISDFVPG